MNPVTRWIVVVVAVLHGLVHLLGAAEGLGWADVPELTDPIGGLGGAPWLPAAVLLLATAVDAERTFAGVTVPSTVRAGWWWGTSRQDEGEFFRAEITGATFR